jgi:carbonic anhydrase/acetyltransferase-like protein (isoleucine patch superfamily)
MDIRAIVLIGGNGTDERKPAERFGSIPLACLDVLGMSVEERVVRSLQRFAVSACSLIDDVPDDAAAFARCPGVDPHVKRLHATGSEFWAAAATQFERCAEEGAELVLVLRLGAYAELDYEEMIQHHLDHRSAVTRAVDSQGAGLDLFVISASARLDAAELFQSRLSRLRRESKPFRVTGYVNRLEKAADLRRLAADGLLARNAIAPQGKETKPGIWVASGARIHKNARVVAPAYIGAHTKIRASALITRGSVVERHCIVDCGTVVENTTLLPFTCVGAGLDAMHCVVGFRRVAHLPLQVEVEIHDEKLVGMIPINPLSRLAGSTAALFAFIPREMYRGLSSPFRRNKAARTVEPEEAATPTLASPELEASASESVASEFPSDLAVVRRYGDH